MPRDLTPLVQTEADLDALAEVTPRDLDDARVWARQWLGPLWAEALDAEQDGEPPDPTTPGYVPPA